MSKEYTWDEFMNEALLIEETTGITLRRYATPSRIISESTAGMERHLKNKNLHIDLHEMIDDIDERLLWDDAFESTYILQIFDEHYELCNYGSFVDWMEENVEMPDVNVFNVVMQEWKTKFRHEY